TRAPDCRIRYRIRVIRSELDLRAGLERSAVIPAKAGIFSQFNAIPAFAGMTTGERALRVAGTHQARMYDSARYVFRPRVGDRRRSPRRCRPASSSDLESGPNPGRGRGRMRRAQITSSVRSSVSP